MTPNVKKTWDHFNEKMRSVHAHSIISKKTSGSGLHS